MMRLTATLPAQGLVPLRHGETELTEIAVPAAFRIAPFDRGATDAALAPLGLRLPEPNRTISGKGGTILWYGHAEALLLAKTCPEFGAAAAAVDFADGLCHLRLSGAGAREALARLVPVDLGPAAFKAGHCLRTLLGKQRISLHRAEDSSAEGGGFEILCARSLAQTAVSDIGAAMQLVAARRG